MPPSQLTLSVLDIGPIRSNQTASDCVASMVGLAQRAEELSFYRYWLAEHHNVAGVVASQTAVLASTIGANTRRIRIGGCVLLPHYSPFLVAEQMALLEACHPGRVDLGVGRSAGTDPVTSSFLRGDSAGGATDHPDRLSALVSLIQPDGVKLELGGQDYRLKAAPNAILAPPVWVLGTSLYSARLAARLGLPYAFGYHISGEGVDEALRTYRREFRPSLYCAEPKTLLSAIVVVGDTKEESERLARSQLYSMSAFRSGEPVGPQMLVEEAEETEFPGRYDRLVAQFRRTWIIGDARDAAQQIAALSDRLGLSEVMINPVAAAYRSDPPDRAPNREQTIAALAREFGASVVVG